jgi:hypothetical protein
MNTLRREVSSGIPPRVYGSNLSILPFSLSPDKGYPFRN